MKYKVIGWTFSDNYDIENFDIYFRLVTTNTILFNSYLCSRRNRLKKAEVESLIKRIEKLEKQHE